MHALLLLLIAPFGLLIASIVLGAAGLVIAAALEFPVLLIAAIALCVVAYYLSNASRRSGSLCHQM